MAASLAKLFADERICSGFSARQLWMHSVTVSVATKPLAD